MVTYRTALADLLHGAVQQWREPRSTYSQVKYFSTILMYIILAFKLQLRENHFVFNEQHVSALDSGYFSH